MQIHMLYDVSMSEKIIGYTLLIIGIVIIFFSANSVYMVFTGRDKPLPLFHLSGVSMETPQVSTTNLPPEIVKALKLEAQKSQKMEIISAEMINTPLNFYAHLFFMGFLATIGYKIASLGVMLVRPLIVKVRGVKEEVGDAR